MPRIIAIACPQCGAKTVRVKDVATGEGIPTIARLCTNGDCLFVSRWRCEFLRFPDTSKAGRARKTMPTNNPDWRKPVITTLHGDFRFTCGCGHTAVVKKVCFATTGAATAYVKCQSLACQCRFVTVLSWLSASDPLRTEHKKTLPPRPESSSLPDPNKPVLRKPRGKG